MFHSDGLSWMLVHLEALLGLGSLPRLWRIAVIVKRAPGVVEDRLGSALSPRPVVVELVAADRGLCLAWRGHEPAGAVARKLMKPSRSHTT